MWNTKPLAALSSTFGRIKGKASHFYHRKGGPLAAARENVKYVHRQVANFEASCEWHELDERHPTKRYVSGFFAAVRRHEGALTGYSEENVEAMDALERESNHLVAAASTLYAIDPALYQARVGVSLLAGVRGLDSKEAFAQYLADLKTVAEDRRERAARREKVLKEGYTDRKGKEHSPGEIAAKAERGRQRDADPTGRDVSLASRTSAGGRGLQDTAANDESMRETQDRRARRRARDPHRQRTAIDAAHAARNALPPPTGAERHVDGYIVCSYIAQGQQQRPTWSHAEIVGRVADLRERNGVPELDRSKFGTHVHEVDSGWRVQPPARLLRPLKLKGDTTTSIYCPETRSCAFPDEDEAVVAYEKFMAPSTSNDERKAMMHLPRDAFICAHCGGRFFSKKQSAGVRMRTRQNHERSCAERSSSSEEEESDEDESEEESDEDESEEDETEEVVTPPPKRSRFSWPLW